MKCLMLPICVCGKEEDADCTRILFAFTHHKETPSSAKGKDGVSAFAHYTSIKMALPPWGERFSPVWSL